MLWCFEKIIYLYFSNIYQLLL